MKMLYIFINRFMNILMAQIIVNISFIDSFWFNNFYLYLWLSQITKIWD